MQRWQPERTRSRTPTGRLRARIRLATESVSERAGGLPATVPFTQADGKARIHVAVS